MIKTSNLVEEFQIHTKSEMTPVIENTKNKFFKNDYQNPYSVTLWETNNQNKQVLSGITNRLDVARQNTLKRTMTDSEKKSEKIERKTFDKNLAKRPPSLCFSNDTHISKKIDSPLNLPSANDYMSLNTPKAVSNKLKLIKILETFVKNEEIYIKLLTTITDVHHYKFKNNKKLKNIMETVFHDTDGEILLFGNISTMIELSELLVKNIMNYLSKVFHVNINSENFWPTISLNLKFQELEEFDIACFFRQSFNQFKQVYMSYSISYEKQTTFLKNIKKNNKSQDHIESWIKGCDCKYDLEYLLSLPIERINVFLSVIEKIMGYGENVFSGQNLKSIVELQKDYKDYLHSIKTKCLKYTEDVTSRVSINYHDTKKTSILSSTSSFYSTRSLNTETFTEIDSLQETIQKFNCFYKHLLNLKKLLLGLDFTEFATQLHNQGKIWKLFMEIDNDNNAKYKIAIENQEDNIYNITMYDKYLEKIEKQIMEVSILQNTVISKQLLKKLSMFLEYYSRVGDIIKEYNQLQKDKQHHSPNTAKYTAIVKQHIFFKKSLAEDLPHVMKASNHFVHFFTLRYNECLLNYLKIMSGGDYFLKKEFQLFEKKERDIGDNFDILQQYSSTKFFVRNFVKDNCFEKDVYIYSKVYRQLFD